eukprot:Platyproteum_vivax@DN14165_c0_g1_i1.p1
MKRLLKEKKWELGCVMKPENACLKEKWGRLEVLDSAPEATLEHRNGTQPQYAANGMPMPNWMIGQLLKPHIIERVQSAQEKTKKKFLENVGVKPFRDYYPMWRPTVWNYFTMFHMRDGILVSQSEKDVFGTYVGTTDVDEYHLSNILNRPEQNMQSVLTTVRRLTTYPKLLYYYHPPIVDAEQAEAARQRNAELSS